MKKYIIYKTINKINNKYYIGFHKINPDNDNYLGSGVLLKKAIIKYGKENFVTEILYTYDNKKDALIKEFELVNENVINDEFSYNLKIGGEGGWDYINNILKSNPEYRKMIYNNISESLKTRYKSGELKGWIYTSFENYKAWNKGKKLSETHKNNISKNNAMNLDKSMIEKRIIDYTNINKSRGYISKLAKQWDISHTSVKRFINKHIIQQSSM